MKKVLITGSRGYIGSHMVSVLSKDWDVSVLDRHEDVRDLKVVDTDAVLHLAAVLTWADPEMYSVNVQGTQAVVNAAPRARIVFTSSAAASCPDFPYGRSKLDAERVLKDHGNAVALRLANVYGVNSVGRRGNGVVDIALHRTETGGPLSVYGDGTQVRDYVHVADVGRAISLALTSNITGVVEIGTGVGTSLADIVEVLRAQPRYFLGGCMIYLSILQILRERLRN